MVTENFWKGKNVLITGISGFIGSKMSLALAPTGAKIVGIAKASGYPTVFAYTHLYNGDVCDYPFLCNVISNEEIDYIFHFASYAIVRVAARDPMTTYRTNVMGTVALLEAARTVGRCKKILVASSDKAYGDHAVLPYREGFALEPKNTYDTSKACMDMIARSYAQNYKMPITVTRCSNVYGPGDPNMSRLIPNTIERVLDGKPPELYQDVSEMEREFVYIDDVLRAYNLLAQETNSEHGRAYNIGGTGPQKINYIASLICSIAGRSDLQPVVIPRDPEFKEIQRQYIDASRLQAQTGWTPLVSLHDGLKQTIDARMRARTP
jgi:CDP-glucose 4,6-dehydratase